MNFLRDAAMAGAAANVLVGTTSLGRRPDIHARRSSIKAPRKSCAASKRSRAASIRSSPRPCSPCSGGRQRGRCLHRGRDHPGHRADRHDEPHRHGELPLLGGEVGQDVLPEQHGHAGRRPPPVPDLSAGSRRRRRRPADGVHSGIHARHGRDARAFGSKPWKSLVEPAIPWAENGFPLDEFTRGVLEFELDGNTYFPAMRQLYAPTGFTPSVGEKLENPGARQDPAAARGRRARVLHQGRLGQALRRDGERLGWPIKLADLTANPPRWTRPDQVSVQGLRDRPARAARAAGRVLLPRCSGS